MSRSSAAQKLRQIVETPLEPTSDGLRGTVREGEVMLYWKRGFGRNSWRPVFRGEIGGGERSARIEGVFTVSRTAQVLGAMWFGAGILVAILTFQHRAFAILTLLALVVVVVMIGLAQHRHRGDKDRILTALKELQYMERDRSREE